MKKSLIALAVLAASGASFAQSNVTLYGIVDAYLAVTSGTNQTSQTVMGSGGVSGSRWGLKGSEDLGGGLKANFLLEQGFDVDTGAAGTPGAAFGRYANVGFSGGFGAVRLGRIETAYDAINGAGHDVFDSALSSNNGVWVGYAATGNNEIYYATPTVSGFSGAVSYALGENKDTPLPGSASNITSLNVQYAAGPLYVGLGYQVEKAQAGVTPDLKSTRVNASYDFGVAKLVGDVGHVTRGNARVNEWTIGGYVPVSTALTLSAGFSKSTDDGVVANQDAKGYGIGAAYSLSKRTTLYAGFNQHKTTNNVTTVELTNKITAAGVLHTF